MVLLSDFSPLINVTCAYIFTIKKIIIFPRLSLKKENFWVYHFCIRHSFWKNVGQTGMDTHLLQIYLIIINFSFYIKCISLSIIKGCCILYLMNFAGHPSWNIYNTILFSMVMTILSSSGWMYTYVSYEQGTSIFSFKDNKDMMPSGHTSMLKARWLIRLLFPIHQSYRIGPRSISSHSPRIWCLPSQQPAYETSSHSSTSYTLWLGQHWWHVPPHNGTTHRTT